MKTTLWLAVLTTIVMIQLWTNHQFNKTHAALLRLHQVSDSMHELSATDAVGDPLDSTDTFSWTSSGETYRVAEELIIEMHHTGTLRVKFLNSTAEDLMLKIKEGELEP